MIWGSLTTLRQLKRAEYLEPSVLRRQQDARLRSLIAHAYENVPFYRERFDRAGLMPSAIGGLADMGKVPITTKLDLQCARPESFVDRRVDGGTCVRKHTSGSTGHPLTVVLSPGERDYQILLNLRILMANGLRLTDRVAYIINPDRFAKHPYWFQRFGVLRRHYLSVFDYPQKHAEELARINPDIIYGYPSNLTLLALHVREQGITGIRPRLVFSVAEALEPRARLLIDSVFGVRTCDILGTIELGDMAWQCDRRDGYHLSSDAVIVEFLRDGKPVGAGEEGRTVCTSLYSRTMPFIRYAVNDVCIPADRSCACGRLLPVVESIRGRANDFIVLPDGQLVASCFLVITMQGFDEVRQYRVVQEERTRLRVHVETGPGFSASTVEAIRQKVSSAVGGKLGVDVETVSEIPRDHSGKIRTVVSRVAPDLAERIDSQDGLYVGRGAR